MPAAEQLQRSALAARNPAFLTLIQPSVVAARLRVLPSASRRCPRRHDAPASIAVVGSAAAARDRWRVPGSPIRSRRQTELAELGANSIAGARSMRP